MPHAGNATNLSRRGGSPHSATTPRSGMATIRSLLPYLWPDARPRRQGPRRCSPWACCCSPSSPPSAVPVVYGRIVDALAPKDNTAMLGDPAGSGDRLWPAARRLRRVRRAARRTVRQGAAARRAHRRAAHLPASACAQPALPSRSPDRCAGPRDRSRLAGHPVGAAPRGVQRGADDHRTAAGHRDHLAPVRLALRRDHLRRGGELCRLHHELRRAGARASAAR